MKAVFAAVVVFAALMPGSTLAQESCASDETLECRERFIDANLPKPRKPDLTKSFDREVDNGIRDAIRRAEKSNRREIDIRDRIAAIEQERSWKFWNKPRNSAEYARLQEELQKTRYEKYAAYNEAIAKTILLYDLVPKETEPRDNGDSAPTTVMNRWAPHYSECEVVEAGHCRLFNDAEKNALWAKRGFEVQGQGNPSPFAGGTGNNDARIGLFPEAFSSPNALAAKIYHESVHWLDHDSLGRPLNLREHFQGEVLAYQREMDTGHIFNLTAKQIRDLKTTQSVYKHQASIAGIDRGEMHDHPDWLPSSTLDIPPGAEPASEGHRYEDLSDIVDQAIRLTKQRAHDQDVARRKNIPRAAPAEEAPPAKLGRLARMACDSPDSLTTKAIEREFADGAASREDFGDCYGLARMFAPPGCARSVFAATCLVEGDPILILRDELLRYASYNRVAPAVPLYPPIPRTKPTPNTPPPSNDPPPENEKPEKPSKGDPNNGCFQDPGSPRGCPKD